MGGANKLLLTVGGEPVIASVVREARGSGARDVIVVTGFEAEHVGAVVSGSACRVVHNPAWADGMGVSLAAGITALRAGARGVVVALGDMPRIRTALIDALIDALPDDDPRAVVVPVHAGRRGNPVLLGAAWFPALGALTGDQGARALLAAAGVRIIEIAADPGVLQDVDDPADVAALRDGTD